MSYFMNLLLRIRPEGAESCRIYWPIWSLSSRHVRIHWSLRRFCEHGGANRMAPPSFTSSAWSWSGLPRPRDVSGAFRSPRNPQTVARSRSQRSFMDFFLLQSILTFSNSFCLINLKLLLFNLLGRWKALPRRGFCSGCRRNLERKKSWIECYRSQLQRGEEYLCSVNKFGRSRHSSSHLSE